MKESHDKSFWFALFQNINKEATTPTEMSVKL